MIRLEIKEGETSPPKRYNSGSMILAMENAGQLIEDEELRAQIKGSGIGTSATRAEILKKLFSIKYLSLNKKTQVITPTLLGEMIFDVVNCSIRQLLNPELTASWEKGLTYVAEGSITAGIYGQTGTFCPDRTRQVEESNYQYAFFDAAAGIFDASGENNSGPQRDDHQKETDNVKYEEKRKILMLKDFTIANPSGFERNDSQRIYLKEKPYPWEVLPEIGDFILKLGQTWMKKNTTTRWKCMDCKECQSGTDSLYQRSGHHR